MHFSTAWVVLLVIEAALMVAAIRAYNRAQSADERMSGTVVIIFLVVASVVVDVLVALIQGTVHYFF